MATELLTRTRTDEELRKLVQEELDWDIHITDPAAIGVSALKGIVSLSGQVPTFAEKMAAEDASHRVSGVRDVANDITVAYPGHAPRTDAEIAQAVRAALEWNTLIPNEKIQSTVAQGWVTLEGEVNLHSQRYDAELTIRHLAGVRGVTNSITVNPVQPVPDAWSIRTSIEAALERQSEQEARRLGVSVEPGTGTVTLTGTVRSWSEKQAAANAAGFARGVRHVDNRLAVNPHL